METSIVDTRKMYCPRFPQPKVLILVWNKGGTECVKAKAGECPYVEDEKECRYHTKGE